MCFLFVWFSVDLSFCLQSVRGRAVIHKSASSVGGVFVCLLVSLFVGVCVFLLADHWCTDPQRCVLGWICGATSDHMFHQHTARSRQGEESSFVLDSPSTTFLSMLLLHVKLYVVAYCHTCFHSTCMWIVNWEGNTLVSPPPGGGKQLCLRLSGTQRTGSGGDQQPTDRPTQKTWWKHCITNTQIQIHCTTNTQIQIHCITHTQSQIPLVEETTQHKKTWFNHCSLLLQRKPRGNKIRGKKCPDLKAKQGKSTKLWNFKTNNLKAPLDVLNFSDAISMRCQKKYCTAHLVPTGSVQLE